MTFNDISTLQTYIDEAKRIVFFGGAGVSTESGIPDFRSSEGIYTNNLSAEEIVSSDYFYSHPKEFYEFFFSKMVFPNAKPNSCHNYLANLEKRKEISIITQNIDGLHQKAGSNNVYEIHGNAYNYTCTHCKKKYTYNDIKGFTLPLRCPICHSLIKPDVVLYGESLNEKTVLDAVNKISQADLLIVGGTSLKVYPAATFIYYYRGSKKVYIEKNLINKLPNYLNIQGKIGEVFSLLK